MKKAFTKIASVLFLATMALWTSDALAGCNDPAACNYVSTDTDTVDCTYPGCDDTTACNYDSTAGCNDGSCLFNDACGVCGGSGTVPGCIDTTACNFNSLADCDDASCLYNDACGVCGGAGTTPGCTDTTACNYNSLADCDDASCLFGASGCTDTTACNYDSLAVCDDGSCTYPGCTDTTSCTYDSTAGCSDGGASCLYLDSCGDCGGTCLDNCLTMDMQDSFGDGWNGHTYAIVDALSGLTVAFGDLDGAQTGDGVSFGQDILCIADGCYTITVGGGAFDGEVSWQLSGVDGGTISGGAVPDPTIVNFSLNTANCWGCTDDGTAGPAAPFAACNYDPAVLYDDGSCDYSCIGCTDTTACNWEADNTVDDGNCCYMQCVNLTVAGGAFESEITWDLVGASSGIVASGAAPVDQDLCVPADCYSIDMYDSFGDGWNGATWTLTSQNGVITYGSGTLSAGSFGTAVIGGVGTTCGCTDSTACNYDCDADTDDGTCCYDECIVITVGGGTFDSEISWSLDLLDGTPVASGFAPETVEVCALIGCYVFTMNDSFGDGWNGATFSVGSADGTALYASGTLGAGLSTGQVEFGIPVACGCTDSLACNYDPAAVADNGTCGYYDITLVVGGGTFDGEISWTLNLDSDGTQVANGIAGTYNLCLNQDCYVFNMFDSFGDGWNGATGEFFDTLTGLSIIAYTLPAGAAGSEVLAIDGGGGCVVPGCTDDGLQGDSPFPGFAACNYNPVANVDDDTCEYDSCDGCQDDGTGTLVPAVFPGIAACDYDPLATIPAACDYSCIGCTNSLACNYCSTCTVDDGSCCLDNCLTLDMTDSFGDGWNGATYDIVDDFTLLSVASGDLNTADSGDGSSVGTDNLCLPDGCYTITVGGGTFDSEIGWTLNGVQGGSVGGGAPSSVSFGVGAAVCALGCTNPLACNYDSTAVTDDGSCCLLSCVTLDVSGGFFESEVSWNLYAPGAVIGVDAPLYSGGAPYNELICVTAGCDFQMEMSDSFGDGWNNCFWTFSDPGTGDVYSTGTLDTGGPTGGTGPEVALAAVGLASGCTDSTAANYDPAAGCDDGSCIFCLAGETPVTLYMFDSFGDGWNGGTYTITDTNTALVVAMGDLDTATNGDGATFGFEFICLADGGCYSIEVAGGFFESEISWDLQDNGGVSMLSGGAPSGVLGFYIDAVDPGCGIVGCTDPNCFNFNPFAGVDDGSCICPPANNDCANAIGVLCNDQVFGTSTDSTDNEGLIGSTCGGETVTGPGVWYVLDGTGDQVTVSTCGAGSLYDTKLFVYEAQPDCSNLVCVAANDDGCLPTDPAFTSNLLFNSSVGVDYYILVTGFGTQTGDFQLDITCTACAAIPANDDCVDAQVMPDCLPVNGDTCCANPEGDDPCVPAFQSAYGVWYSFDSQDFDTFDFTLNNGSGASVGMTVWVDDGGGCGALTALACCGPITGTCAGDISAITTLIPFTTYYFTVWTTDAVNCGSFDFTACGEYLGCTDPSATNYDSQATIDDGSCEYDCGNPPPANDNCTTATAIDCVPNGSVSLDGTTGCATIADYPLFVLACNGNPGAGVWYTFAGTGDLHTISTCGSPTDTQIDIFTGACGALNCAQDVAPSPNAGAFLTEVDDADVAGQCGFFNQDDVYLQFISDPALTYYIHISTPQPINGGAFTILHECETVVPGCMEPAACNYDSTANVDDGSCDFISCLCADAGCAGTGTAYVLEMQDSFGDGWNGATWEITDGLNNSIMIGDLDNADVFTDADNFQGPEFGTDYFCLCDDNCYTITVGGGSWDSEISWQLYLSTDLVTPIAAGGAPGSGMWSQGGVVCGCTDPGACNFNPLADTEDGSCEYITCAGCTDSAACNYDSTALIDDLSCCFDNCVTYDMFDSFGDGWNGGTYTITNWNTGTVVASGDLDTATNGDGSSFGSEFFCLPDGCYFINVAGGFFESEITWTLGNVNGGGTLNGGAPSGDVYFSVGAGSCTTCQEALACNYDANAPVADCNLCDYDCQGCTYSFSPNYDSTALIDDGSCTCPPDPCPADFDDNNVINTGDLLLFLQVFGTNCP